jgi:site-specific DNA recombinase
MASKASLRAGIYTRLSSDPDGSETATARQEADCRKLCKSRGWTVATIYKDTDLSAYDRSVKRPEFERLLGDIKGGSVDVVVVWKSDRFARQPWDLERFLKLAEPRQVALASVTEPFDVSNGMGLFMARMMFSFGNYESTVKSERIQRKMAELAKEGRAPGGGTRPFGYEKDRLTIRKPEAEAIRDAAKRVLAGEPLRSICTDWNRRKIKTPTGGTWAVSPLRRVLTSGRIAGLREHKTGTFKAAWPKIIDTVMHEKIKAVMSDPSRRQEPGAQARRYLLSGLLRCGRCDGHLVNHRRNGKRSYVCPSTPSSHGKACGRIRIAAEPLEEFMAEAVVAALESPKLARALKAKPKKRDAGSDLRRVRADEQALAQLSDDYYVERLISRTEFFSAKTKLETRIASARTQFAEATGRPALARLSPGDRIRESWESNDLSWRRELLASVLESVTIQPAKVAAPRFDTARINVVWRV